MSKSTLTVSVLFFLVLSVSASAQDEVSFEKFKVLTRSGEFIGVNGVLDDLTLTGKHLDGKDLIIPRQEIRNLYKYSGTKAGNFAMKGAGVGLLIGLLGVLTAYEDTSYDPYTEVDENRIMPVMAVCTGGGALIGALIGSGKDVMERVPVRVRPTVSSKANGEYRLAFVLKF